jgi:hypothetical protein
MCWNLECIINTEQQVKDTPDEMMMGDLLNEEARMGDNNAEDAEDEVAFIE